MNRNTEVPTLRQCTGVSKYVQRGMFVGVTCCNIPQTTFKGGMSNHSMLACPASPLSTPISPHF